MRRWSSCAATASSRSARPGLLRGPGHRPEHGHRAARAHGHARAHDRPDEGSGHLRGLVMRSGAQEAFTGVAHARDTLEPASLRSATSARSAPSSTSRCATRSMRAVARAPHDVRGRVRDLPRAAAATSRASRRRGRRAAEDLRFGVADSETRSARGCADPALRRRLHQGDRDRCRDDRGTDAGRAGVQRGRDPRRRRGGRAYDAHVAAHAHGAEGIKRAVRAGVRSIEHGSLMDDEAIDLMAEHGTYLVADIYDGD